ncbi:AAA family ATPase [Halalkalibacter kiskunsagensis]|uniref:Nuclease SbcCD subunit C n=1 Tax=Halalkalibacter kiskunsagensis TaxID=1548599 RepID=A0ABV6KF79_9BACI
MNNIKAVRLENFQSHLDTYVEFSGGLNVIVGQSDSGKTAILRGIRWALYNQPRGSDFIRVSADFVRVTITFDDETVIIRERTSSKNRYTLRKKGQEELVLEGFGIHVPKEVMDAHGMSHLKIDHDNDLMIHLSQQLDGPFLLEQTSSIRAKTLGRISGAHFLDMAIRDTTKDLSQLNIRMKQEQATIDKLQDELQPFSHLDELKNQLLVSEERVEQLKRLIVKRDKLAMIKKQWEQLKQEEEKALIQKQLVKDVDNWQNKVGSLQTMVQRCIVLTQKQKRTRELNRSIDICHTWLQKTEYVNRAYDQFEQIKNQVSLLKVLQSRVIEKRHLDYSVEEEKKKIFKSTFIDLVDVATVDQMRERREKQKRLRQLKEQIQRNKEQLNHVMRVSKQLPDGNQLLKKHDIIANTSERSKKLKSIQARLLDFQSRLEEGNRFIKKQTEEQICAEQQLQQMLFAEGTCPTCGQEICKHGND